MTKKILKNMVVEITSEKPMANGETVVGNGTLYAKRNLLTFEECKPVIRKKNPVLYRGVLFRLRKDGLGNFRFNAIVPDTEVDELISAKGTSKALKDLRTLIGKVEKNKYPELCSEAAVRS